MKEPDHQRDALPVDWVNRVYGVLQEGHFKEAPLEDVEPVRGSAPALALAAGITHRG